MGEKITLEEAESLFRKDLIYRENKVKATINVPMTLDMYAACVAFAYNAGNTGFATTETVKLINQKKYKEATEVWKTEKINLGTNTEKGLRRRRAKEVALFLNNSEKNIT
jgi:GH24 family phage-related lysozyme (muramidase)